MKRGLIQVYTGEGKGKTTAAVGLAVRARSHNLKVCYIHFHKGDMRNCGEIKILKKIGVDVFEFAGKHPCFNKNVPYEDIRRGCLKALRFIKNLFSEGNYDLIILDEINISLRDGFLKEEEVLETLNLKPKEIEVILTGRGVPRTVIEKADLVSEVRSLKHPYSSGLQGRKGIEY